MPSERVAGRYVLGAKLGSGRGGHVHQAKDSTTGARVAVKLRTQPLADDLDIERAGLRSLEHPHLVQVLDSGTDNGRDFIVTELVAEGSLEAWKKPLPVQALHELVTQLLEGLAYLHGHGILHGDVKTENILVASKDPPHFKLGDFGLARQSTAAALGGTLGSPAFMPPEIVRGEPADERSDLYSLGIVLYECTFGTLPFEDDDVRRVLMRHLTETPEHLTSPGSANPQLVSVLRALLAKEPAARPANARLALELWQGETAAVPKWVPKRLGVLIGRDEELEMIEKALAGAEAAVSIGGVAGTGKTRLLREVALRAELRGTRTVWWTPHAVHGLEKETLSEEAESEQVQHSPILTAQETKSVAERRARDLLSSMGPGPWLLFVDDMDLAPDWFVDSLSFLLRDVASDAGPGRLVCLAGREKAETVLREALEIAALPVQPSLTMAPWPREPLEAAAGALFGARLLHTDLMQLLEAATGSVPAEVEAVCEKLSREGFLRLDTHGALTVAAEVTAEAIVEKRSVRIAAALEACSEPHIEILRALSTVTSPVSTHFLKSLGCSLSNLASLQRSGLVTGIRSINELRYAPAHEGVLQAVLNSMPLVKRRSLHDRIAAILEKTPGIVPGEESALHRARGTNLQEARSAVAKLIGRPTTTTRPELLREAHEALLQIWPEDIDPDARLNAEITLLDSLLCLGAYDIVRERAEARLQTLHVGEGAHRVRNRMAEAILARGDMQSALEVLEEIPRTGRQGLRAEALRAHALLQMGRNEEAIQACEDVASRLEPGDLLADRVLGVRVLAQRERGLYKDATRLLENAIRFHEERGETLQLPANLSYLGAMEFSQSNMQRAEACFERAHDLFKLNGDRFGRLRTLNALGIVAAETGRYSQARELFRLALDLSQRIGDAGTSILLGNLGQLLHTQGHYRQALEKADLGLEVGERLGLRTAEVKNRIIRGGILASLGFIDRCQEEMERLLKEKLEDLYQGQVLLILSDLALRRGDLKAARPWIDKAEEILKELSAQDEVLNLRLLCVRLNWADGDHQRAIALARATLTECRKLDLLATRCEAEVLLSEMLMEEFPEEAIEQASSGLELAQEAGLSELIWRLERVLGRVALGKGNVEEGLSRYQSCVVALESLSADLPTEAADSYLSHPDRMRVFRELAEVRDSLRN